MDISRIKKKEDDERKKRNQRDNHDDSEGAGENDDNPLTSMLKVITVEGEGVEHSPSFAVLAEVLVSFFWLDLAW